MPSLDIVSRVELQEVDNAINNTLKALAQRYDFRGSTYELTFDRKASKLNLHAEDQMKLTAIRETLLSQAAKRKLELKVFQFGEPEAAAGNTLRCEATIAQGIPQDMAKKIVKLVKDSKIKVQASIQGDEVRLSGKNIDDLQAVMGLVREADLEAPVQFVNMKR